MSSVSNGLYFLTLPPVSVMRVDQYIKRNVEKVWGARYTLGARYLSKNMVILYYIYWSNYCTKWSLFPAHLIGCSWYLNLFESAEHYSTCKQSAQAVRHCTISCCSCTFIVMFAVLGVNYVLTNESCDICNKDDT